MAGSTSSASSTASRLICAILACWSTSRRPVRSEVRRRAMKLVVKVTLFVEVEVNEGNHPDYDAEFDIEENHRPGTGVVGAAIEAAIRKADADRVCWGCQL